MPRAAFWPGGALPLGPDYAEFGADAEGDVHRIAERTVAQRRKAMRGSEFALDYTPAGEMELAAE